MNRRDPSPCARRRSSRTLRQPSRRRLRSIGLRRLGFEPLEDRRLLSSAALGVPLEAVDPPGSLIYESSVIAQIAAPEQAESFELELDAGQTMTVVVDPGATLRPTVALFGPGGASLATATAGAAGETAILQAVAASPAGSYTVTVDGAAETTGDYTLRLILNAAVEREEYGGPANDDAASAEDLDASFVSLNGGPNRRGAVLGMSGNSEDWFRFTLDDGRPATLAATKLTSGHVALELYDEAGDLLAVGAAADNLDSVVDDFVDPTTDSGPDTYFIRVTGISGTAYSLALTSGGDFETEPNDGLFPGGPNLSPGATAIGALRPGGVSSGVKSEYVIHVSVDGLAADLLHDLVDADPGLYSSFHRLQNEGAFTYNARADYTYTVTLPNHVSMLTGRPVSQPPGRPVTVQHGWTANSHWPPTRTLHDNHAHVDYIASVFDVVHDYGLSAAHFAGKSKFSLFETSYNEINGAPDPNPIGGDNGRNKIDVSVIDANTTRLTDTFIAEMTSTPRNYGFLHLVDPDSVGHVSGWGSPEWNQAVALVDGLIGELFDLVDTDPQWHGKTSVIVTADHGGLGNGHSDPAVLEHYRIPFFVWGPGVPAGADLYALAPECGDPGTGRPDDNAVPQPIRNGDSANLALELLGLPAIPGSSITSLRSDPVDHYGVEVIAGDVLSLETSTPADGPGEFINRLDPSIELYDPGGTLVAGDDNGAADGRNARLTHTAATSGTYTVRVLDSGETGGEYLLNVTGHTGTLPPFAVTATNPADGALLLEAPAEIVVTFSDLPLISSLDAPDLTIDGLPGTGVRVIDGVTIVFDLPAGLPSGPHGVAIPAGAILDLQGTPVQPFAATIRTVVDLGTVDFLQMEDLDPSAGDLWYGCRTARQGILTLEAVLPGDPESGRLTLYAEDGNELAASAPVAGAQRIDWQADAGTAYFFRLSGASTTADLWLTNLVQATSDGSRVSVYGTDGDDWFEAAAGAPFRVTANGVGYEWAAVASLSLLGGGGFDTATLSGSAGDEVVTLHPRSGTVSGPGYQVQLTDVASIAVSGGGGADSVWLFDSSGDDTLVATPTYARLSGDGYSSQARFFQHVDVHATQGGRDVAKLYDSSGNDTLVTTPTYAGLFGAGFSFQAEFFDAVHAYASGGGFDVAKMFDSSGDDTFYSGPVEGALFGNGFYNRAKFFDQVHAYATAGGLDVAHLFDSAGDDTFYGSPVEGSLFGDGFYRRAKHFEQVRGYASQGGYDVARLHDSAGHDSFVATPNYGAFYGDGFHNQARGFEDIQAYAEAGGFDVAKLFDSPQNDYFVATPTYGAVYGDGFRSQARHFEQVHAYATAGGFDAAKLFDSSGSDTFFANPVEGALYGDGFYNRAKHFDAVRAYATAGGLDLAELYDSAAGDTFFANPVEGALYGEGFYNRAKHFETVNAYATADGNDVAELHDSALDDLLEAENDWARLDYLDLQCVRRVSGFDQVAAIGTTGVNTKNVRLPLVYVLGLEGPWAES